MYDLAGLKTLWTTAGGAPADATIAAAIALAESGGNAAAINKRNANGSWDVGLWQINTIHQGAFGLPAIKDYKNPAGDPEGSKKFVDHLSNASNNAKAAVAIKSRQGFQAWAAYNNGSYKKFLPK